MNAPHPPARAPRPPRPSIRPLAAALALGLCLGPRCRGDVTLPALISDNMVLEQRTKVNVWGKADPGESVTVELGPQTARTTAGSDGAWSLKLDGLKAGGPYDLTVTGKNSISIRNVAVGEVWVCAGESNMEMKAMAARNAPAEMADADLPMVRLFIVKHAAADTPQADCEGAWVVCTPESVKDFSAVGAFFARELNRGLRTPVGMIESAWGPSPVEAWMPRATLENAPDLHAALDRYAAAVAAYPAALKAYEARLAAPQESGTAAAPAGKPVRPQAPGGAREPAALYNGMIAPLVRYPIRGVLWYQGESNTYDPAFYGKAFPAMIAAWRAAWDEGEFPFFYAQLSGFLARRPQPGESNWAALREAQARTLTVPKTGMAVTADTGEENEMHPADKQDVAHRLALLAESEAYGKGVTALGPVFAGMTVEDAKCVITFAHAEGGLTARNGGALKGFAIAGEDGKFAWADARIDGAKVTVQSGEVPHPAAVRYGWADFPDCDLFNKAGLPAAPFQTDDRLAGVAGPAPEASPSATPAKRKKHRA